MKAIFLIPLLVLGFCTKPSFHLKKFSPEEADNGAKITVKICMDETLFKVTRYVVEPQEIIKGDSLSIKVQGEALEPMTIVNLHISTKLNGFEIFVDDKPQEGDPLEEGDKFEWTYTAYVPTIVPPGAWDVYATLITDKGETVSCLLVHWDME